MAEGRIVKFCERVDAEILDLWSCDDKLSRRWASSRSRDVLIFWEISVNISNTVQDRDIITMEY